MAAALGWIAWQRQQQRSIGKQASAQQGTRCKLDTGDGRRHMQPCTPCHAQLHHAQLHTRGCVSSMQRWVPALLPSKHSEWHHDASVTDPASTVQLNSKRRQIPLSSLLRKLWVQAAPVPRGSYESPDSLAACSRDTIFFMDAGMRSGYPEHGCVRGLARGVGRATLHSLAACSSIQRWVAKATALAEGVSAVQPCCAAARPCRAAGQIVCSKQNKCPSHLQILFDAVEHAAPRHAPLRLLRPSLLLGIRGGVEHAIAALHPASCSASATRNEASAAVVLGGRRRVLPLGGGWAGALAATLRGLCRLQKIHTQPLSFCSTPRKRRGPQPGGGATACAAAGSVGRPAAAVGSWSDK